MKQALIFMLSVLSSTAMAAEVSLKLVDGKLGAQVTGLVYPPGLPKELRSGLTNRLYARITLADAKGTLRQKVLETAIRFDLWDEQFFVTTTMDGVAQESRTVSSLPQLNQLLAALPLNGIFISADLPENVDLTMRIEVLLNPIGVEKMRMIRRWVAENSTPQLGGDQGVSISNVLFNRIFEQYADGSDVAAIWRDTAVSTPFRVDALKHDAN